MPKNEADYLKLLLQQTGLSQKVIDKWLSTHPPPNHWQGGKYSWAYTEMPVW